MKTKALALFAAMTLFSALRITVQSHAQNNRQISASQTDPKAQAKIFDQYGKLPLSFETNQGQMNTKVKFFSRGHGYSLFLTGNEAVIVLKKASPRSPERKGLPGRELVEKQKAGAEGETVLRMELAGANAASRVLGVEELPGKANYFIGNDPAKWRTNVPTYAKVKYEGVYPGVDLVYYGNQGQLEYDFLVAPGADPNEIRLKFRAQVNCEWTRRETCCSARGARRCSLRSPWCIRRYGARGSRSMAAMYWLRRTGLVSGLEPMTTASGW